jgi:hypothetical protein
VCTLTWHDTALGYHLFFNRDERRERLPASPPRLQQKDDTRFVAPSDGDSGGTWIAVNEHGLCLCLLNGFPAGRWVDGAHEFETRGRLPLELIGLEDVRAIPAALERLDLARFRPFVLVAIAAGGHGHLASWSGRALEQRSARPPEQPLISSSYYTEEVRRSRSSVFRRLVAGGSAMQATARHLEFHRSHLPARGAHSPCMHRPDARTVSFSHVEVGTREIRFHYVPHPPCRELVAMPALALDRRPTP